MEENCVKTAEFRKICLILLDYRKGKTSTPKMVQVQKNKFLRKAEDIKNEKRIRKKNIQNSKRISK